MVDTFDHARMSALKEYARLEYELCLLLKAILGVEAEIASAIFYQIANTRTRYAIIEGILDIRHADTFLKPWPKLERWLTPRDTARNHIVHWGQDTRIIINLEGGLTALAEGRKVTVKQDPILSNNARKWRARRQTYSESDLKDEEYATKLMKHIINRFNLSVFFPDKWPWTDIFQRPITDPTPEAFLRRLNDRGFPARLEP